jgi:hypothetical protein
MVSNKLEDHGEDLRACVDPGGGHLDFRTDPEGGACAGSLVI